MKENEFEKKWEDWYADLLSGHQWLELDYKGRRILYVCGRFSMSDDGSRLASTFTQVIGYLDSDQPLNEEEQKEIKQLFCRQQGVENVSFWSHNIGP
jgi:hypothetical protein